MDNNKDIYLEKLRRLKELKDAQGLSVLAQKEQPSLASSVGTGLTEGASLGFADKIQGGVDALLGQTGSWFTDDIATPKGSIPAPNPYAMDRAPELYARGQADRQKEVAQAMKAHPIGAIVGSIAGGLPYGLATGAKMLPSAALGAAASIGGGKAEDWSGAAVDALKGGIFGAVASKIGNLFGKTAEALETATPAVSTAKTAAKLATGLPEEAMPESLTLPSLAERPKDWFFKVQGAKPVQYASDILPELPDTTHKVVTGGLVGHAVDMITGGATHGMGAAVGVAAGLARSKPVQGLAQMGLDAAAPALKAIDQSTQKIAGLAVDTFKSLPTQYQQILSEAAAKGGRQAAITHFLLSQQDPAYRSAVSGVNPQE